MNREIKEGITWSGVSFGSSIAAGFLDKASKNAKNGDIKILFSILKVIALGVAAATGGRAVYCFQNSAEVTYRELAIPKGYYPSTYV